MGTSLFPPGAGENNNDVAGVEDHTSSLAESELMGVYDAFQDLSIDGRPSSSSSGAIFNIKNRLPVSEVSHAYPCEDTFLPVPPSPPEKWPQRPILLRPSPESGMRVRGVRYSSSETYLPLSGTGYCNGCILPINNGLEKRGQSLVIDFESDLFIGTAMLRIKNVCHPPQYHRENAESDDSGIDPPSYFHNKKRTFNGVIRGRFKIPSIPMSECVTGQVFNKPAGNLPPRIIMKGAISIISHLAPQLQARLDGDCPRFFSPLVSTAQSAMSFKMEEVKDCDGADESIEAEMSEPQPSDQSSLIQELPTASSEIVPDSDSIKTRMKSRKRIFDKLHASGCKTPTFDPNAEYTFEFFQHLLSFDEFALDFGMPIGKHPLCRILNGQPLKFMAAHQFQESNRNGKAVDEELRWLWSFDLWHESLYEDAKSHDRA
mmetsp:Transcript_5343/g.11679  ORF Transcript_5343/g.11679 Transcript_5343/m.11679 type:complete len:431 (+) Transcript_5343:135-1427(+)